MKVTIHRGIWQATKKMSLFRVGLEIYEARFRFLGIVVYRVADIYKNPYSL